MKTLAIIRQENMKSRQQVAKAVGLSLSGYANIELGNRSPSFKVAKKLANYFKVPIESINFGKSDPAPLDRTGSEG